MDDEVQYRCAGYIQAEIERYADEIDDGAAVAEGEKQDGDSHSSDDENENEEKEAPQGKGKGKAQKAKKGGRDVDNGEPGFMTWSLSVPHQAPLLSRPSPLQSHATQPRICVHGRRYDVPPGRTRRRRAHTTLCRHAHPLWSSWVIFRYLR
jgi:hypothetical protein